MSVQLHQLSAQITQMKGFLYKRGDRIKNWNSRVVKIRSGELQWWDDVPANAVC